MKTNVRTTLLGLMIPASIIFSSLFFSNCKGKSEIHEIVDSVENCAPPFVVYFYPEAEHRTRKLEYTWEFGDGATSHEQEPVHTYSDYGNYTVTLSIKQNKAFDSYSYNLNLTEEATVPFAEWDYAVKAFDLWAPAYVEFQNYSEFASTFLWEYGDGNTSTNESPIHIYDTPGTYTTILNAICMTDTAKAALNMTIKDPPSDILIDEVTVWMPAYAGSDAWVSVYYAGHHEEDSGVGIVTTSAGLVFPLTLNLYWFNGDFNPEEIVFEIWVSGGTKPEEAFVIKSRDLQLDYYPDVISFDNSYGIAMEVLLEYRD